LGWSLASRTLGKAYCKYVLLSPRDFSKGPRYTDRSLRDHMMAGGPAPANISNQLFFFQWANIMLYLCLIRGFSQLFSFINVLHTYVFRCATSRNDCWPARCNVDSPESATCLHAQNTSEEEAGLLANVAHSHPALWPINVSR
jgi:hypothetical protein